MIRQTSSIGLLPIDTRSELRSTQILTSLPQLVSELVQNSLDAGAKQVDVGVDADAWSCWVRDDGMGMSREGMNILAQGREKGRYGTSKAYNVSTLDSLSTFGFRGEALASAVDLSCVEISSRCAASPETWSVIIKGNDLLYNGPSVRWRRERPGTTISVRDAFYNLPVRRSTHTDASRTLEIIKKDLETLALVFPSVGLTLENSSKERREGPGKGRLLTVVKTSSPLETFRQLFGRALVKHAEVVHEKMGEVGIEGFISLGGAHSKAHQFLYVDHHPLDPCELHRVIDTEFTASTFGKRALDETEEAPLHSVSRRSPRKNERRPIYVLNIVLPTSAIDLCLEPRKATVQFQNFETVLEFLRRLIQSFLIRHGFRSSSHVKLSLSPLVDAPSPQRQKRGSADVISEDAATVRSATPFLGTPTASKKMRSSSIGTGQAAITAFPDADPTEHDWTAWQDPETGESFIVDTRSGNSFRRGRDTMPGSSHDNQASSLGNSSSFVDRRWLRNTTHQRLMASSSELPNWMNSLMQDWANPAFGVADTARAFRSSSELTPGSCAPCSNNRAPNIHMLSNFFEVPETPVGGVVDGRFSKVNLGNARVIKQVDRKFIACSVPHSDAHPGEYVLVLIDQHAADERIRVERFLRDLCLGFLHHGSNLSVETRSLDPPKLVLVTEQDAIALGNAHLKQLFARWGFALEVIPDQTINGGTHTGGFAQVAVHSVPDVVALKLLAGDELRELIKGLIAKATDEPYDTLPPPSMPSPEIEDTPCAEESLRWLKALRWCPKELLDLVNSRACRGAIMFNDTLTQQHCRRLVSELARTVFPFQCAHGRPSLVPLVRLNGALPVPSKVDEIQWATFSELAVE